MIDPDAVLAGDQSFTFIGIAEFTAGGANYQLRVVDESGGGRAFTVEGDVDHDGVADFRFIIEVNQDNGSISYIGETNFIL